MTDVDDFPVRRLYFGEGNNTRAQNGLFHGGIVSVAQLRAMPDVLLRAKPFIGKATFDAIRAVVPCDESATSDWRVCPHCGVGKWESSND